VNQAVNEVALPDVEALVAEILERPLFSPSRLPVHAEIVKEERTPITMPGRLAGTAIRPEVREALFVREGEKPIAVRVGQEIDGWIIAAIEFDRVVLTNSQGEQIVKPTNGPIIVRSPAQLALSARRAAPRPAGPRVPLPIASQPRSPVIPSTPNRFQIPRPFVPGR
jgi:hypothetical protein